jgi:hypothetical protein
MGRIARLSVAVALLSAGLSAVAGPAAAAPEPAVQESFDYCSAAEGGPFNEVCQSGHYVFKRQTTPSGGLLFRDNEIFTTTYLLDGQVLGEESHKLISFFVKGTGRVEHLIEVDKLFSGGRTCTYTARVTAANGEVRHTFSGVTCVS